MFLNKTMTPLLAAQAQILFDQFLKPRPFLLNTEVTIISLVYIFPGIVHIYAYLRNIKVYVVYVNIFNM
jgi:hypothetical protein